MTGVERFARTAKSTLFDHLRGYKFILVSGPHRAGTTIAAAMIANDLDYEFVEDAHTQLEVLPQAFRRIEPTVFHCPTHCHKVHEYVTVPGLAAVMVIRDIKAIIASQERIPWGFENKQLHAYRDKATPKPAFIVQPPVAEVKYRYWREIQKPLFGEHGYEIEYESLKAHTMWVAPEQRRGFTTNQIEVGKPHGPRIQGVRRG